VSVAWGIFSTAAINDLVLAGAAATDACEVVAVASRDAARAEAYAREHGIERAHGSYEALLEDPNVEAVYIPLPNSLHIPWTLRAVEAGKHVLCEKPFSRHADEVEEAFERAEAAGLVVSEGFMWRHHPQTAKLVELVQSGAIGRLRVVRCQFGFDLEVERGAADTRFDPELDGGALMDVGCYCINAMRLLAGEPERVSGEQVVGPTGVDVVFAGTLAFADDVVGHFHCGFVFPRSAELEVVGASGTILVRNPWVIEEPAIELRRDGDEAERISVDDADSYRLELENVSGAIRGEIPLLLGRDDAVGQARTIEALYEAAGAGQAVPTD
jgi:D-xylose 1-dehydrogenase (NADP+, D-xylono-1,5-lactone-forming)